MKPNSTFKTALIGGAFLGLLFVTFAANSQELAQVTPVKQQKEKQVAIGTAEAKGTSAVISHSRKSYIREDGVIYWNKSQPVYLSLLTSPDDTDGILVKVDQTAEIEPYYFDTEGVNFIRTKWRVDTETGRTIYPKEEVLWPVVADGIAPTTFADFNATGKFVKGGTTYYSGDLKVALNARDKTSGVESVFYSLGGGFDTYSNPFSIDSEKEWELSYYAVDKVGNFSRPATDTKTIVNFTVDKTAPKTDMSISGPSLGNILSSKALINLSGSDQKSGVKNIKYQITNGARKKYVSDISLASLEDGLYNLNYAANDNVSNSENENNYEFYLDKIAPQLAFNIEGDQFESTNGKLFISKRSKIALSGTDNKAGINQIHFKLDNTAYNQYSNPINTSQSEGLHSVEYYGVDKVENSSDKIVNNYTIDDTPPIIKYQVEGPQHTRHDTLFVRTISSFTLNPTDEGTHQAGLKYTGYQINEQKESAFENSFSFQKEGLNSLIIKSSDKVNNNSELTKVIFVDNKAPLISQTFSVKKIGQKVVRDVTYPIYPEEVKLYLAAKDGSVGSKSIYYQLNDQPEKLYTSPLKGFKLGSNVELKVRATDILGSEETASIRFSVE